MLTPQQQAARIVAHYLKHLTLRTGLRWTTQNERDMALLAGLLGAEVEADDTIPPYDAPIRSDRVTEVFEREGNAGIPDQHFQTWRGRQRWRDEP